MRVTRLTRRYRSPINNLVVLVDYIDSREKQRLEAPEQTGQRAAFNLRYLLL